MNTLGETLRLLEWTCDYAQRKIIFLRDNPEAATLASPQNINKKLDGKKTFISTRFNYWGNEPKVHCSEMPSVQLAEPFKRKNTKRLNCQETGTLLEK